MDEKQNILLSVIIPAFNEEKTIAAVLRKVLDAPFEKEVVVIDDGSSDRTGDEVSAFSDSSVRLVVHEKNRGKGAALSTGFAEAAGEIVIIQDADLEYDPECYPALVTPIMEGKADVVYGSRFAGAPHRVLYYRHYLANKILTAWSNLWSNLNFSDMETGYKVFRREVIFGLTLKESRFGVEPEITQKLARRRLRILEVPITYYGRTYEEGKKIGVKDAFRAFWCVVRYSIAD